MPLYRHLAWHNPFSAKEIAKIPTERTLFLRELRQQKRNKKQKPIWSRKETIRIFNDERNKTERQIAYVNFKIALDRVAKRVHVLPKPTAFVCE